MLTRALAALAMLGLSVVLAEGLRALPASLAALGLALFGAAIAPMIAGSSSPLAIGLGALGALAYAALRPSMPIPAAAVFAAMVFAARAMRARDAAQVIVHVATAALGGAAAGWVILRFADAEPTVRAVSIGVATLLASAPFALHAEDPRVYALLRLAGSARGPARVRLLRAAALRRRTLAPALPIAPSDRRRVERAFRTVARLAEARLEAGALEGGAAALVALDRALAAHVHAVGRLVRALRARWASGEAMAGHEARDLAEVGDRVAAEAEALDELAR